ncbi:MAG: hypothetical protein IJH12_03415 [Clostridia bacterium]|nr:hypothetical protein [Clostridia bacterium]
MSHNVFAKTYVEMRDAKYHSDGTQKENTAICNSAQEVKTEAEPNVQKDKHIDDESDFFYVSLVDGDYII